MGKWNGYQVKRYEEQVKRYCQTLDLKDDPELIEQYKKAHSEPEIWKEILEGIRSVGILEMEIYLLGNRLFMIVETPMDFDWEVRMDELGKLPRQAEWEDHVGKFQQCLPGARSDQKWQLMDRIFKIY